MSPRFAALLALLPAASGCVARAMFTDGTSVAVGRADRGVLRGGRELPLAGDGYVILPQWAERGNRFGTDELVSAIERAAATVAERHPGGVLGVGDLSHRGGGAAPHHRSHENGRDADLIFYAVDSDGAPVPPVDAMPRFRGHGLQARRPFEPGPDGHFTAIPPRRFDLDRNWALVEALLSDPSVEVEYLFISERLRDHLIEHARGIGADPQLIDRARRALKQPPRFPPHDDHLHLRIRCSADDRFQGCVDEGRVRLRAEVVRPPRPEQS